MPASLLTLANELLLSIAENLDTERSINAIARTNRRLNLLLNGHLYRYNVIKSESSALSWGVIRGLSESVVKSIAQAGNVNVRWDGFLKLRRSGYRAILNGETRVVDLLKRYHCSYCTPIYLAILSGHEEIVDLLLKNGADIESGLGPWANPLQAAAQCGQYLVVRRLSTQVSDIDKPAPYTGRTALHIACFAGNDIVVQHLIEEGANLMVRDNVELDTPLHLVLKNRDASQSSIKRLRIVQWLLISGADMYARNREGQTPVSMARQMKGSDVGCLFKKGCKIAAYEASFQVRQQDCGSVSLQRLWAAYLDKQTEVATEASRLKRIAATRAESANQRRRIQQEREDRRRFAKDQKQAREKSTEGRNERANTLQEHGEDQQKLERALLQNRDTHKNVWFQFRAKGERINQLMDPVAKGRSVNCKHVALAWQRRKGKVDCASCHIVSAKCFFFQCPDCEISVCQSCTRKGEVPG